MFCITALPKDKSVMMLYGNNNHFHAGSFHRFTPLIGIEFLQIEHFRIFHTVPPFHPGKRIRPEMNKSDKLILQCRQLVRSRNDMGRLFDDEFLTVPLFNLNRILKRHTSFLRLRTCRKKHRPKQKRIDFFHVCAYYDMIIRSKIQY